MSNGDWDIPPELGKRLSKVVRNNKPEAIQAAESLSKFCSFLKGKNEDEISRELSKHPEHWEEVRRDFIRR
jgi:hypothetical protein